MILLPPSRLIHFPDQRVTSEWARERWLHSCRTSGVLGTGTVRSWTETIK
jgi:hypothetical protein